MEKNKPKYIILHHTSGSDSNPLADTSGQTFEIVDDYHRQKWNFKSNLGHYLGYQYFIDKSGKVTQAREDTEEGAHTIGQNKSSIGICLAGNFDVTMPTTDQISALRTLLLEKMVEYSLDKSCIVPHRKFANKSCNGKLLSDNWGQILVSSSTKTVEPCISKEEVLKRDVQIGRLQKLIEYLINLIKK